jgi:uncharacterized membrane protein
MDPFTVGTLVFVCLMAGAYVGMCLRNALPQHHVGDESKDVVKLATGLVATMTALVLGLVIASAKSSFDERNATVKRIAADVLVLDRLLARYGSEATEIRADLRRAVAHRMGSVWPASGVRAVAPNSEQESLSEHMEDRIRELSPQTDTQRWLQVQALDVSDDVLRAHWSMLGATGHSVPPMFLIVIACWLAIIFASFGLFAPRNGTVIGVLIICALSVSAAIILILELDRPFDGAIKVSSTPLRAMLPRLGE